MSTLPTLPKSAGGVVNRFLGSGKDCVEKALHVEVADVRVENTRMEMAEGWRLR